jgi:hypothetical protein
MIDRIRNVFKGRTDGHLVLLDQRLIDLQGKLKVLKQEVDDQAHSNQGKFAHLEEIITNGFRDVLDAIANIQTLPTQPKPLEVKFVFKVADDHQEEPFSIAIGSVTDAEGQPIPDASGLSVTVESSDENVVSVTFDETTKSGSVSFGAPGVASVTATVTNKKGDILGSGAADFTVTTGDPAAVSDVRLAFSGLTEEAPADTGTGGVVTGDSPTA